MASNDEPEQMKEDSQNFVLKNVGKFWILKTNKDLKRLVFLDNAKDVRIDENILIADERLFEIHKNETGEYLFRRLQDLTYDTYFVTKESSGGQLTTKKHIVDIEKNEYTQNQLVQDQSDKAYINPINENVYEEINGEQGATRNVKLERDTITGHYDQMPHPITYTPLSALSERCIGDLNLGSDANGDYYDMVKEHEEDDSCVFENKDRVTNVADMTPASLEGSEFEVEIERSKLAKMYSLKGKMTLSFQDKEVVLKDVNTQSDKCRFPYTWIKRFGIYKPFISFEMGAGKIICKTKEAEIINRKCLEVIKTLASKK